jgi:hypothetical protein
MSTLNEHLHQPPTINVEAIERELTSLWQQASKEDDAGGVTRASMFNLLVYAPSRAAAKDLAASSRLLPIAKSLKER